MDVRNRARSGRLLLFAACLHLLMGATALADPMYTIIDLGTGPTYGVDSSGNGTVTGSNGLTYTFNPVQNYLPAQWSNTTQGVPTVYPAPTWIQPANNPPGYSYHPPYSYSNLNYMNSQGLAAGINLYGSTGYQYNSEVFLTQRQANGSWGAPIPLWSGGTTNYGGPGTSFAGIMGVSPQGQLLGYGGVMNQWGSYNPTLYLYDTKTQALTNLTSLINSMMGTNLTQLPPGESPNWSLHLPYVSQLDNQGRILVQADQADQSLGGIWVTHTLLLIPESVSADPIPVPEPESWAVFATLIGGWIAHKRLRSRTRS